MPDVVGGWSRGVDGGGCVGVLAEGFLEGYVGCPPEMWCLPLHLVHFSMERHS